MLQIATNPSDNFIKIYQDLIKKHFKLLKYVKENL